MPYIVSTLVQLPPETDAAFETRVQTFVNDQWYYFTQAGGVIPVPKTGAGGPSSWLGYPPLEATSDNTIYDPVNAQLVRTVTFSYNNDYYYKFLGITPPIPPPPPFATAGDVAIWTPGGGLTDGVLNIDTTIPQFTNLVPATMAGQAVEYTQIAGFGTGTVTSVSVVSANGFAGTVANPTTTPAITISTTITGILKGNGTAILAATPGTDYLTVLSGDVTTVGNVATIAANAVTYAKMQAVSATSKLLGSSSVTTPVQEITIGSGLSLSGTTLTATGSGGTVTSVGLSLPAELTVSGSPVTGTGTLTAVWANETGGYVFAGPTVGSPPGTPSFRALVSSDIPDLSGTYLKVTNNLSDVASVPTALTNLFGASTDYSGTSTIVGWTSFTSKQLNLFIFGKYRLLFYRIVGVSNSTSTSITIDANVLQTNPLLCRAQDNGGTITTGLLLPTAGSNVISFSPIVSSAASWTASGQKQISGWAILEVS